MPRHVPSIPAVCLAFLISSCGAGSVPSENPETWEIHEKYLFAGLFKQPANPFVEDLVERLNSDEGDGVAVTKDEFVALVNRTESSTVYREQLIKVATPRSVAIQNREHRDFLDVFMAEKRISAGVDFLTAHQSTLAEAEDLYSVARRDIVSILMWESGLGEFTGDLKVFNVLMGQLLFLDAAERYAVATMGNSSDTTVSNMENRAGGQTERFDRIRNRCVSNLVALLRQSKAADADPLKQLGSWGGAIGYPQFMPFSMGYAKDGDGDGTVNLHTWPDAIMSVANYLKERGEYDADTKARRSAIHSYNPIDSYVSGVVTYADTVWARHQAGN